ncbi:Flagellar motor rotation protein MotB [hydrothermal vent metagenome]|uniref:Flagellar motor rotation protein MotB n=1 Tax=hydrothermal vent metagenome TaxID=652676 RepID=A0A3B0YPB0_9ZZZZ
MEDKKQPIIVKKINKGGHGHHGGAWKVAMADFAIAMMAFFMVMWLLGGTSVEQKAAISSYFKNPSLTEGKSHVAAQGQMGPGGASTSMIKLGGTMELPKGEGQRVLEKSNHDNGDPRNTGRNTRRASRSANLNNMSVKAERQHYKKITKNIEQSFKKAALKRFKDQLLIDITDDGLRIQIIDKTKRPMFSSGSSRLQAYADKILNELGLIINKANSKISITGHTDAKPYTDRIDYSNWELSADRANTARRAMLDGGLKWHLVARIIGMGSSILLDRKNPKNPINRRISILVLNAKALAILKRLEQSQAKVLARWHSSKLPNKSKNKTHKVESPVRNRSTIMRRTRIPDGLKNRSLLENYKSTNQPKGKDKGKAGTSQPNKETQTTSPKHHDKKTTTGPSPKVMDKKPLKSKPKSSNPPAIDKQISKPATSTKTEIVGKAGKDEKVDTSVPEKYRGKPAVRAGPGMKISLPPIIDRSF